METYSETITALAGTQDGICVYCPVGAILTGGATRIDVPSGLDWG